MVKKLYKYEFSALGNRILPMYAVVAALALALRLLQLAESDTTVYRIVFWSAVVALGVGAVVCCAMTAAVLLVRFYRHFFSSEGYLTFTLPVTPWQLLRVKLVSAVGLCVLSLLVILASVCLAAAGRPLAEGLKALFWLFHKVTGYGVSAANLTFYALELAANAIAFLALVFSVFYACLCLGQLANRLRLLLSFGVFLALWLLGQLGATLCLVFLDRLEQTALAQQFLTLLGSNPTAAAHEALLISLAVALGLTALFTGISLRVLRRHLNLE